MPAWTTYYVIVFWPCLAIVFLLGVWRGDRLLIIALMLFTGAMIADRLTVSRNMYAGIEASVAIIDLMLALSLTLLSVMRPRTWLIALAASQYFACLGHLTRLLELQTSRLAYAILTGSGAYPALMILCWGIADSIKRRRKESARIPNK